MSNEEKEKQELLKTARKRMDKMLRDANKSLEKYKKKAEKLNKKEEKKNIKTVKKKIEAFEKGITHAPQTEASLKKQEQLFNELVEIQRVRTRTENTLELALNDEERDVLRENLKELDRMEYNTMGTLRLIKRHGLRSWADEQELFRRSREEWEKTHPQPKREMSEEEKKEWDEIREAVELFEKRFPHLVMNKRQDNDNNGDDEMDNE